MTNFTNCTVECLEKIFNSPKIEPFIRKVVFTNFKNISQGQELIFDYPITALVGPNGTNKTSALIALFGSVANKTPAEYWFTTALDRAQNNGGKGESYQSYFYTYKDGKNMAEVLLVNNQRTDRNADYWETDKPKKQFGMNTEIEIINSSNKSKTRWSKINKNVIYINFRSELSSFDRCLYHANKPSKHYKTKQDYIRAKSPNIRRVIKDGLNEFILNGKQKILSNKLLSKDEVQIISSILNKSYTSIQYVEHTFFDVSGGTAFIKTDNLDYSEAYAGSGEFAVISLVEKIMAAPENSLILLDEPEVSLHPNAQKQLINFLSEQVKYKKHQIVISTHSPEIVERLPNRAIKLFSEDIKSHKVLIDNKVNKLNVFHVIGKEFNTIPIYVEDRLAQAIIEKAIEGSENLKNSYHVEFFAGGAGSIISRFNTYIEAQHKQLVFLDGDQQSAIYKKNNNFPDSETILDINLDSTILNLGFEIKLQKDSNSNSINQKKSFLDNVKKCISYLPFDSPEYFILNEKKCCNEFLSNKDAKEKFKQITIKALGEKYANSDSIYYQQITYLNQINPDCLEFKIIRYMLEFYLDNNTLDGWFSKYRQT